MLKISLEILRLVVFISLLGSFVVSNEMPKELKDPALACDGCYAVMSEISTEMQNNKGQKLQRRVQQAVDNICHTDKLRAYKFSPPTQVRTCNGILSLYKTKLVNILTENFRGGKTADVDTLMEKFCRQVVNACVNMEVPTVQQKKEREEKRIKFEEEQKKKELNSREENIVKVKNDKDEL